MLLQIDDIAAHAVHHRQERPLSLQDCLTETDRFPAIRVARDYPVLRRIGRLRHEQYIARQGKGYRSSVLDRDCLIEDSDFRAVNLYAVGDAGITSAMRVADVAEAPEPHRDLYHHVAGCFAIPLERTLTCTRLVRAASHSGRHAVEFIRFVRWQTVNAGWRYCLMQTAERLVPFFRKVGFYESGTHVEDPAAGRLQVLIMDTKDIPTQGESLHAFHTPPLSATGHEETS